MGVLVQHNPLLCVRNQEQFALLMAVMACKKSRILLLNKTVNEGSNCCLRFSFSFLVNG